MWIVELALRRPHTFIVMAITIVIFGVLSVTRMAIDIFPVINLPIISCVWNYTGMSAYDMENLVTTITERALTSTVNGIQRMESMSIANMSIIKLYLQQGTPIGESVAMVESVGSAIRRQLPRGINPPFVTSSSATDVPVLQLVIRSEVLNEAQLFDIANNLVRGQLATVQGTIIPFPYGGKYRSVMIDLNPGQLYAHGLSPYDIVNTMENQNVIAPCGTCKMGSSEYYIVLNNIPKTIDELNNLPIKSEKAAVVYLRDVAHVHDGWQPQLNVVNLNGKRAVLFNILKNGEASTLTVVQKVKDLLPKMRSLVPESCHIDVLVDQSLFVRECVDEVIHEALTAAGLTALMMLALLGSWRSTLIVATSIPLSILCAIIGLNICGQTINSMTLGGLALAVGMLVDDATVVIENVHSNMVTGTDVVTAILEGARQVALPALVSTLSICIVFVPVVFLTEPSRSLFMPMGLSVILAMMASYGLSRTLVPLMMKVLLAHEHDKHPVNPNKKKGIFTLIHEAIENIFEGTRARYQKLLSWALSHQKTALLLFMVFYAISFCLTPSIGADYFPTIDAGQLRLHISAHAGTRVEETERIYKQVEKEVREIIPAQEIDLITHNIGMAVSGINYAFSDSQTVSEADGEMLISLKEKRSHTTSEYQKMIRELMKKKFPQCSCYFQPGDIVTQILNAGLPAPIDVRLLGLKRDKNYQIALKLKKELTAIPGAADVTLHQVVDAPHLFVQVDRIRAQPMGLTQNDISNSVLTSLSSSFQTNPNFWTNLKTGVNYNLAVQTPQSRIASMENLGLTPVTGQFSAKVSGSNTDTPQPQFLMNVSQTTRKRTPAVVNHLNVLPVYDIFAACQGRDLEGVAADVHKIVERYKKTLPEGSFLFVGGQVMSMYLAFAALIGGLAFALLLVYLLLVVNFQSWTDPLIILMAIPGAFAGIMWALYVTQTTFSIPALMGAIMTVGVASANSILMVNFAKEELGAGKSATEAALNAGFQRFRPVIMTASAMIIGMIPMAIGAGQGGSQNAPIGRVVIGGLLVATFCTLVFVPMMFSVFRSKKQEPAHVDS